MEAARGPARAQADHVMQPHRERGGRAIRTTKSGDFRAEGTIGNGGITGRAKTRDRTAGSPDRGHGDRQGWSDYRSRCALYGVPAGPRSAHVQSETRPAAQQTTAAYDGR